MKKLFGVLLLVAVVWGGIVVFGASVSKPDNGNLDAKVPRVRMILEVTSSGGDSANVEITTLEGKQVNQTVETPFSKTVRSSYAKVVARPSLNVKTISCRIVNADNGDVLKKDGPSERSATCLYDSTK